MATAVPGTGTSAREVFDSSVPGHTSVFAASWAWSNANVKLRSNQYSA